ncbi:hypothetical protein E2C01_021688 [Portunus trituberculatus]|uniref:Uncharacterized protein n=1 Tax=Portunus trituberculatus TaxID=210409 RepID=A0A5B7E391_PORTR|nr:hypothetical protein [Portunus trituberculatus]
MTRVYPTVMRSMSTVTGAYRRVDQMESILVQRSPASLLPSEWGKSSHLALTSHFVLSRTH